MTDHLRASPLQRYEEISRHLLEQAQQGQDSGDILQASEKAWGATAHAIKAVAQQRGWNHHAHSNLRDAANYIGFERNRQDLRQLFMSLEAMHHNYYEHRREAGEVQDAIDAGEIYVWEMAKFRREEPPATQDHLSPSQATEQERRLRRLIRKTQYSHDNAYSDDELDELPPVRPFVGAMTGLTAEPENPDRR